MGFGRRSLYVLLKPHPSLLMPTSPALGKVGVEALMILGFFKVVENSCLGHPLECGSCHWLGSKSGVFYDGDLLPSHIPIVLLCRHDSQPS